MHYRETLQRLRNELKRELENIESGCTATAQVSGWFGAGCPGERGILRLDDPTRKECDCLF
jgi:hypothetical protein